jgi:hypothetical protein
MKRKASLFVTLIAALLCASTATAANVGGGSGSREVRFSNETEAKAQMSSFWIGPNETVTFRYPTSDGGYDVDTASSVTKTTRSFNAIIYSASFRRAKHNNLGIKLYEWSHYTEWAGNGSMVTNRFSNAFYNWYTAPAWSYAGLGSFVDNTIVGPYWYAGRQGHYKMCLTICLENHWPWHEGIYAGNGWWTTYNWDNG